MARSAASYNRAASKYRQQPKILIICEDKESGKRYLEKASFSFRVNIHFSIEHCGFTHPKGIVEKAISRSKDFNKVICVIDRDIHESYDEAILLAAANSLKVEVVTSNPCFEFWLLLHFGYTRRPYNRTGNRSAGDLVVRELRTKPGFERYDKGGDIDLFKLLLPRLDQARTDAARAWQDASNVNDFNPSTQLYWLMDLFESLQSPQPK